MGSSANPRPGDYRVQTGFGGSAKLEVPDRKAVAIAERVVAACPVQPLFAKIDLIRGEAGDWQLIEAEVVEPELWFRLYPEAATLLVEVVIDYFKKLGLHQSMKAPFGGVG